MSSIAGGTLSRKAKQKQPGRCWKSLNNALESSSVIKVSGVAIFSFLPFHIALWIFLLQNSTTHISLYIKLHDHLSARMQTPWGNWLTEFNTNPPQSTSNRHVETEVELLWNKNVWIKRLLITHQTVFRPTAYSGGCDAARHKRLEHLWSCIFIDFLMRMKE